MSETLLRALKILNLTEGISIKVSMTEMLRTYQIAYIFLSSMTVINWVKSVIMSRVKLRNTLAKTTTTATTTTKNNRNNNNNSNNNNNNNNNFSTSRKFVKMGFYYNEKFVFSCEHINAFNTKLLYIRKFVNIYLGAIGTCRTPNHSHFYRQLAVTFILN
jgi:hypothetical protein